MEFKKLTYRILLLLFTFSLGACSGDSGDPGLGGLGDGPVGGDPIPGDKPGPNVPGQNEECSVRFDIKNFPLEQFAQEGYLFKAPHAYSACESTTIVNGDRRVEAVEGYPYLNLYQRMNLGSLEDVDLIENENSTEVFFPVEFDELEKSQLKALAEKMGALNLDASREIFLVKKIQKYWIQFEGLPAMKARLTSHRSGDSGVETYFVKVEPSGISLEELKRLRMWTYIGKVIPRVVVVPEQANSDLVDLELEMNVDGHWSKKSATQFVKDQLAFLSYRKSAEWLGKLNTWLVSNVIRDRAEAQFVLSDLVDQFEMHWRNPHPTSGEDEALYLLEGLSLINEMNSRTASKLYFDELRRLQVDYKLAPRFVYSKVRWLAESRWTAKEKNQFLQLFTSFNSLTERAWVEAMDLVTEYGLGSPKLALYRKMHATLTNSNFSRSKSKKVVRHFMKRPNPELEFNGFVSNLSWLISSNGLDLSQSKALDFAIEFYIERNIDQNNFEAVRILGTLFKGQNSPVYGSKILREIRRYVFELEYSIVEAKRLSDVYIWLASSQGPDFYASKAYKEVQIVIPLIGELGFSEIKSRFEFLSSSAGVDLYKSKAYSELKKISFENSTKLTKKKFAALQESFSWMVSSKGADFYRSKAYQKSLSYFHEMNLTISKVKQVIDLAKFIRDVVDFYGSKSLKESEELVIQKQINDHQISLLKQKVRQYLQQGHYGSRAFSKAVEEVLN